MSRTTSHRIASGLVFGLFAIQLLAIAVSAQAPPDHTVSDGQQDDIEATFGTGAPFGDTWHRRNEAATFYLHTDAAAATGDGQTPPSGPGGPGTANFTMDLSRPTTNPAEAEDATVLVGSNQPQTELCIATNQLIGGSPLCTPVDQQYQAASFTTFEREHAHDDMQLLEFSASVHVAGLPQQGLAYAFVYEINSTTGERVGDDPLGGFHMTAASGIQGGTGQTSGPIEYRGSQSLGTDGITLPEGHSLEIVVGTATTDPTDAVDPQQQIFGVDTIRGELYGSPGLMFLDSVDYPSSFQVVSDSARVNFWTETRNGELEDTFPAANINEDTPANVADRQFLVHVVQANAWGPNQFELPGRTVDSRHDIRVRLMETADEDQDITSAFPDFTTGSLSVAQGPISADGSVEHRLYHFIYPAGFDSEGIPLTQDGRYRIEVYQDFHGWKQIFDHFIIGQRGFTFELADGETAEHEVIAGEPTEFAFKLTNDGPTTERIGISVPTAGGWSVERSHTQVQLPGGHSEQVFITVTPPLSAGNGDSRLITVAAASLLSNDVQSLQVEATVTDQLTKGVDLSVVKPVIQTRPGLTDNSFFQLRNTGNAEDRFVLTASGQLPGWGVSMQPSVIDVAAASRADIILQISAPPEAQAGDSFTLVITAVSAVDGAVADVLEIPVTIFTVLGVDVDLRGDVHRLRTEGDLRCQDVLGSGTDQGDPTGILGCFNVDYFDRDFDRTTLARFRLENIGDLEETFKVEGFWSRPGSNSIVDGEALTGDSTSCHGGGTHNDGVPFGWAFNIDNGALDAPTAYPDLSGSVPGSPQRGFRAATGFSGIHDLGAVTLAAGEQMDLIMEFGMNCRTPAARAEYNLQVTSENDPSFIARDAVLLVRDGAGAELSQNRFAGGFHDVLVDVQANQPVDDVVFLGESVDFDLIVANAGNERDTTHISVSAGKAGWTHEIVQVSGQPDESHMFGTSAPTVFAGNDQGGADRSAPSSGCIFETPPNPRGFACSMGAYDEVHFKVRVTPPQGARFGDEDVLVVNVVSGDSGHVFDNLLLTTRVTAPFAFLAEELNGDLEVEQGGIAAFPYTIRNIGLRPDSYIVTVDQAPSGWTPIVSDLTPAFVPGGFNHLGFLSVSAPANAPVGQEAYFRIGVESIGDPLDTTDNKKQVLDFFATVVAPSDIVLSGGPVQAKQGEAVTFTVDVEDTELTSSTATLSVDPQTLPRGWSICAVQSDASCGGSEVTVELNAEGDGAGEFQITAPAGALSISRFTLRVDSESNIGTTSFTDVEINLSTLFAVQLEKAQDRVLVVPGEPTDHLVNVTNTGLSRDTITLSNSDLPTGWSVNFDQRSMTLEPQETKQVVVTVTAPASAQPGAAATFLVFGQSQGDASKTAQVALITEVGNALLEVTPVVPEQGLAPEETGVFIVEILNNGTLTDTVQLDASLASQYQDRASVDFPENGFTLQPGQAREVRVEFTMPRSIAEGTRIAASINAHSLFLDVVGTAQIIGEILPHVQRDVDRDGLDEFAVSRDGELDNGFEEFRESSVAGGVQVRIPDLTRFLSDGAEPPVTGMCSADHPFDLDGNGDGRCDHLLDNNADDLPDIYWDPYNNVATAITVTKDVTQDGVREYFIDNTGNGFLDVWFDLTTGLFGDLIQVDVGTRNAKYVVDLNGNGVADANEPILLAASGRVTFIESIDVDGDGRLDQVIDEDGDGRPDYFVPAGTNRSIPIVLEDVTGDGQLDWTYDADGDGKRDSYYDPATGKSGLIDTKSAFTRALMDHWYVPAIFGLVLVLFVVLMAVTRR